jgi:hypothetical protein
MFAVSRFRFAPEVACGPDLSLWSIASLSVCPAPAAKRLSPPIREVTI